MKRPATIDGSAVIASTTVRTTLANRPPTSVMKIAVPMPSGSVIATAMPTWISEPTMACSTPPLSKASFGPTPDMSWVKKLRWMSARQPLTATKTTALTSTTPTSAAPMVITVAATRSRASTAPPVIAAVDRGDDAGRSTNHDDQEPRQPGEREQPLGDQPGQRRGRETTLPTRTNFSSAVSRPSEARGTAGAASSSYRGRKVVPTAAGRRCVGRGQVVIRRPSRRPSGFC